MHIVRGAASALYSRAATLLRSVQESLGQALCDVFTDLIVPNVGQNTPRRGSPPPVSASLPAAASACAPSPTTALRSLAGAPLTGPNVAKCPPVTRLLSPLRTRSFGGDSRVPSPLVRPRITPLLPAIQFQANCPPESVSHSLVVAPPHLGLRSRAGLPPPPLTSLLEPGLPQVATGLPPHHSPRFRPSGRTPLYLAEIKPCQAGRLQYT